MSFNQDNVVDLDAFNIDILQKGAFKVFVSYLLLQIVILLF